MTVPARMNLLTLACRDVARMREFFRALGWPEAPSSDEHYAVFQLENGVVLSLWGAENYIASEGERIDGFRGFTLGINLGSWDELEAAHAACATVDGVSELGRCSARRGAARSCSATRRRTFWEVAWAAGTTVGPHGELTWF